LRTAQERSAATLYTASAFAFRLKRVEEAGFLFYVARIRAQFDKQLFPPIGKGGDNPMLVFGALREEVGNVVNPAVMGEPKLFARVLQRVKEWSPEVAGGYKPGWEYSKSGERARADATAKDAKEQFLAAMGGTCALLQDGQYFTASTIVKDYNRKTGADRPSKDAFDAAWRTMEKIEAEKGIQGITSKLKR
jgi:hypothetical protein